MPRITEITKVLTKYSFCYRIMIVKNPIYAIALNSITKKQDFAICKDVTIAAVGVRS